MVELATGLSSLLEPLDWVDVVTMALLILVLRISHWGKQLEARLAARHSFLDQVMERRRESYPLLWDLIGDICPPRLIGGRFEGAGGSHRRLSRERMETIAEEIDGCYNSHGSTMDAISRYWTIALREECFAWLCTPPKRSALEWSGKDLTAIRIWFTKTALRISLSRHLTHPEFLGAPRTGEDWIRLREEIRPHLLRNYRLVKRTWKPVIPTDLPPAPDIEARVIDEVLSTRSRRQRRADRRALRRYRAGREAGSNT